ncbi:MAG: hypothetical protein RBU37_24720 [Myxococcota bacterium]|jgi:hypothetical protein|nr:hypothetical protein [Myxococcota bacterium]
MSISVIFRVYLGGIRRARWAVHNTWLPMLLLAGLCAACSEAEPTETVCPDYVTSCPAHCRAYNGPAIDEERDCLRTEPMLCVPDEPDDHVSTGKLFCQKRVADGVLFWVGASVNSPWNPERWSSCSEAEQERIRRTPACPETLP